MLWQSKSSPPQKCSTGSKPRKAETWFGGEATEEKGPSITSRGGEKWGDPKRAKNRILLQLTLKNKQRRTEKPAKILSRGEDKISKSRYLRNKRKATFDAKFRWAKWIIELTHLVGGGLGAKHKVQFSLYLFWYWEKNNGEGGLTGAKKRLNSTFLPTAKIPAFYRWFSLFLNAHFGGGGRIRPVSVTCSLFVFKKKNLRHNTATNKRHIYSCSVT